MTHRDSLLVPATNACRLHHDVALFESRRRKTPLPPKGRTCADCAPRCSLHDPERY